MTRDPWVEELYEKNMLRMTKMATRLLGNESLALDMVHETFERLMKEPDYRELANPAGWLFITLKNVTYNYLNKADNRNSIQLDDDAGSIVGQENVEISLGTILPVSLSRDDRDILVMYFEKGLTYSQIAEIYGISQGNARLKLHRAKEHCKKILEENDEI